MATQKESIDAISQKWLDENPGELPGEVDEEAGMFGLDVEDPEVIEMIRDMLRGDPDMFGDWDRWQ